MLSIYGPGLSTCVTVAVFVFLMPVLKDGLVAKQSYGEPCRVANVTVSVVSLGVKWGLTINRRLLSLPVNLVSYGVLCM